MNQLLEHVITLSNSNFRGRYIYSGYETLSRSFAINANTEDGFTNSITYRGDNGSLARQHRHQQRPRRQLHGQGSLHR